jgi:hypothetical protein
LDLFKVVLTCAAFLDFPVIPYKGTKSVVISTVSWIGGKNPFLGWSYIASAAIFALLALAGTIRHLLKPRCALSLYPHLQLSNPKTFADALETCRSFHGINKDCELAVTVVVFILHINYIVVAALALRSNLQLNGPLYADASDGDSLRVIEVVLIPMPLQRMVHCPEDVSSIPNFA